MEETKELLKQMLLEKSIRTGEFTLASGKTSDLYVDCRVTAMDPFGANLIGELGLYVLNHELTQRKIEADCIGGMTMGADPISLAIGMTSARLNPNDALDVFTVRKEPKGHGRGKRIEGNFESGQSVILVDDVITTGGSALKAADAIEGEGGIIKLCIVLVDREEGGREAIEARGIPVIALYRRQDLLG